MDPCSRGQRRQPLPAPLPAALVHPKFVYPTHREARQTEMLELGTEEGFLQEPAGSRSKGCNSLLGFREGFFIGRVREGSCRV